MMQMRILFFSCFLFHSRIQSWGEAWRRSDLKLEASVVVDCKMMHHDDVLNANLTVRSYFQTTKKNQFSAQVNKRCGRAESFDNCARYENMKTDLMKNKWEVNRTCLTSFHEQLTRQKVKKPTTILIIVNIDGLFVTTCSEKSDVLRKAVRRNVKLLSCWAIANPHLAAWFHPFSFFFFFLHKKKHQRKSWQLIKKMRKTRERN